MLSMRDENGLVKTFNFIHFYGKSKKERSKIFYIELSRIVVKNEFYLSLKVTYEEII